MKKINKNEEDKLIRKHYDELRSQDIPYIRQIQFGLWEIFDGTNTIVVGKAGYQGFNQVLRKAINDEIKKIKSDMNGFKQVKDDTA